jgi:hypothetical protein
MKTSSYIGQLSSGYESDTVKEYDPAVEEGQIGKEETEKVTTEPIWKNDQRIPGLGIGVLSFQEAAIKLRKIARTLATLEMDYQKTDKQAKAQPMNVVAYNQMVQNGDLLRVANRIQQIGTDLADHVKKAQINHPEEKPSTPPWLEESSAQTGDEQWIDIGQAKFDDPRDPTGRAA